MFETQQHKTTARSWLIGIFLMVCGVLTFAYIEAWKSAKTSINIDGCRTLCPGGIEKYEGGACTCIKPDLQKPALMDCSCKPNWREE